MSCQRARIATTAALVWLAALAVACGGEAPPAAVTAPPPETRTPGAPTPLHRQ